MTTYLQIVLEEHPNSSLVFITKSLPFLSSLFLSYIVKPWQELFFYIGDFYFGLIQKQAPKEILIKAKLVQLRFTVFYFYWRLRFTPIFSSLHLKTGS